MSSENKFTKAMAAPQVGADGDNKINNNQEDVTSKSTSDSEVTYNDNDCVVCFKNVDLFSVGECDHPVCYECSTRMRVLCQQNECPICRQVLSKVIFTYNKLSYRELEAKNRSEFYSKKYKIGFYTSDIQQKFFELLDHPCPKCNCPPYRTFGGLRNHVRKDHDLYYCDLCVENLKIFTFERRCYTQAELGLHRTKGDPDNRSHRGHPLCEYCNKRYLDRDELFRHLRREHYYCHFCDADGCNEFYRDYTALADHFRQDHYLCEEGKCATEEFTGAFRSEIDYKAHVANIHGQGMNKQQAKQTRTLQLEITLGPRGRSGQTEQGVANMRSRGGRHRDNEPEPEMEEQSYYQSHNNQHHPNIDPCSEQEFPSLAGAASGPSVSLTRAPPPSIFNRSRVSGLARTKENFPALGGDSSNNTTSSSNVSSSGGGAASTRFQKPVPRNNTNTNMPSSSTGGGVIIHVSNRQSNNKKSNDHDFPTLPMGSKAKRNQAKQAMLEEDMPTSGVHLPMASLSTKHHSLVDDYVSVANPVSFQKFQMVQKDEMETKARPINNKISNGMDFPALPMGGHSSNNSSSSVGGSGVSSIRSQKPISSVLKKAPNSGTGGAIPRSNSNTNNMPSSSAGGGGMVIHVSNRPNNNKKSNGTDYPTLPMGGKAKRSHAKQALLDEDMPTSGVQLPMSSVSTKHHSLVDDYVSVANPVNFQKFQMVQKEELETKARKEAEAKNAPKLTSQDFPSLGGSSAKSNSTNNWVKSTLSDKKQKDLENRTSKIAPAPLLPKSYTTAAKQSSITNANNQHNVSNNKKDKKPNNKKSKEPNNNNENNTSNSNASNGGSNNQEQSPLRPPPGFQTGGSVKPPPGFQQTNVTVNSVAKSPNNLTFTSSLGESYSILPAHSYTAPTDALARNQKLVGYFKDTLKTPEGLEEFRHISQKFREGVYKTDAYYEHCQAALKDKFDKVFPELLVLLPDISKQQALFLVHQQRLNNLSPQQRKSLPKLDVCSTCKQVLMQNELEGHRKMHDLKQNFPKLNGGQKSTGSA